jgi:hypothetical protein
MGWKFKVHYIAEQIAKEKAWAARFNDKALAEKFNAIAATPLMTMADLKAKVSIQWYCEQILKLTFSAGYKTKCPFHNDTSGDSFVIHPAKRIFTCFGGCPPINGREYFTGDVIDLHQRAFTLENLSAARQSLAQLANGDAGMLNAKPVPFLFFSPEQKAKGEPRPKPTITRVDAELVAKVLAQCLPVCFAGECATASDFTELLLEKILRPDDKPIVFVNQKWPIIGVEARAMLRDKPDELQYICSCTAKTAIRNAFRPDNGTNRKTNLKERIFLDVEFDDMPDEDQLKILWWLKRAKGWKLVSITFSGNKSYHGLFYVRGKTDEEVEAMHSLAKRLGACYGSLRRHQPVRFPGGWRRERGEGRQTILYLNRQLTSG